jgi:hypothetical protein
MIPEGSLNKIRSVDIYFEPAMIVAFHFFDKDGEYIWHIGYTRNDHVETVKLAENEVIIGVIAKSFPGSGEVTFSITDFQF